jgi:hypothetical protein
MVETSFAVTLNAIVENKQFKLTQHRIVFFFCKFNGHCHKKTTLLKLWSLLFCETNTHPLNGDTGGIYIMSSAQ